MTSYTRKQEVIEEINRLLKKIDDCLTYISEYVDKNLKIEEEKLIFI